MGKMNVKNTCGTMAAEKMIRYCCTLYLLLSMATQYITTFSRITLWTLALLFHTNHFAPSCVSIIIVVKLTSHNLILL